MRCLHSLLAATQVGGLLMADADDDAVADFDVNFGDIAYNADINFECR